MLKRVQHDIQLPVTLNRLGFPAQKQVVRFTTLALFGTMFTSFTSALRKFAVFDLLLKRIANR